MSNACVIIGASHAGVQLALQLRKDGWSAPIILLSDEELFPYQKPPLSKGFLSGKESEQGVSLTSHQVLEKQQIELRMGSAVERLDRNNRNLVLTCGRVVEYAKLVFCTGARARKFTMIASTAGGEDRVCYLRTLLDAKRIKRLSEYAQSVAIIGGGYIGLECAASLAECGLKVHLLEAQSRLLARVASEQTANYFTRLHQQQGVNLMLDCQLQSFATAADGVVLTTDEQRIKVDFAIVGIGVVANTELAEQSGLTCDNGICVDQYGTTEDSNIFAMGDCTVQYHPVVKQNLRLESIPNCVEQARVVSAALCGKPSPKRSLPWFWSDQYQTKLQIAGVSNGYEHTVVRGSETDDGFSVFYYKNNQLIAADCINRPQEFMLAKRLIVERPEIEPQILADVSHSPMELLKGI